MPPPISDNESSSSMSSESIGHEAHSKSDKKGKGKASEEENEPGSLNAAIENDDGGDDDGDDEIGENEYVVEAIISHSIDEETGELTFEVKWEGYDKLSERTWEPEENLQTASKILNDYLDSIGGKELIIQQFNEKKAQAESAKKGKKRARASTASASNGAKRGKKKASYPGSSTPPASASKYEFKPPSGNWEEEVVAIDACEGSDEKVVVYLTWKGGQKTQHPLSQIYKRCPQKMLRFYEDHLVFKKTDTDEGS